MSMHSRRKLGWIPALALLAMVVGGLLTLDASGAAADPLLDLPFTGTTGCDYQCRPCGEENDGHDIVQGVLRNATAPHLENCSPGNCSSHVCGVEVAQTEEIEELWFAVREAQGEHLRELLAKHEEIAYYNDERDAVQVRGCNGTVLASIPLSDEQVALLEEE